MTDPNTPDPDTGWKPGMPALILFAGEDGAIVHGWRLPTAYSPDGAVTAVADELGDGDGFPLVNPAAWRLLSSEHAPARPRSRAGYDLGHDQASGGSAWQGRAGELTTTDRGVMLAVTLTAKGAALDLSAAVRDAEGTPIYAGAALSAAVAGWLRDRDIDPDTGTSAADGQPGLPVGLTDGYPAPLRPAMESLARETAAAQAGARGAAEDLNRAVRTPDGTWRYGADLTMAVSTWLGLMGVAPAGAPPGPAGVPADVLAASSPVPPAGLPLGARHRWVCAWALTVQARTLAPLSDVTFHGIPAGTGTDVAVESRGRFVAPLANTGYHKSPTGFGAGYEGSGAAALARSLLVAALGAHAACRGCLGAGRVTWLPGESDPVPWLPEHDQLTSANPEDDPGALITSCDDCDGDGIGIHPAVYQAFKRDVVARLDGAAEWYLTREDVRAWVRDQLPGHPGVASWAQLEVPR
jgi:hypothetical protein